MSNEKNLKPSANKISTYTISARGKSKLVPIKDFISTNFSAVPLPQIESVFGFVERSSLYGGRAFQIEELTDEDIIYLNEMNIGLRIPLTNHFVDRDEFIKTSKILEKHHNPLNSVICTNDELALWIRTEFPSYEIEASVIKNLSTKDKISDALEIYNTVVLPMSSNDNDLLLDSIEDKSRIRLFANAGCAYTCPAKICYKSVSKMNKFQGGEFKCSQTIKARQSMGMIDFELQRLQNKGYHKFKLLRTQIGNQTGY
jgi:hypothetical protein